MKKSKVILYKLCGILLIMSCSGELLNISPLELSGANIPYNNSDKNLFLNVAVVALEVSKEKEQNLNNISSMVKTIMDEKINTRLIVFGETTLGWYYDKDEPKTYQRSIAETIPGTATNLVSELCIENDIYIVLGLTEIKDNQLYNSQVVIDPSGDIIAIHNKFNLIFWDIEGGFVGDRNLQIVDIDGFKAGLRICADFDNKWLTKKFIENNVDIVISSNATDTPAFNFDLASRRTNTWNLLANRTGIEGDLVYEGFISISDPLGNIVAGGNGGQRYTYYSIGVTK